MFNDLLIHIWDTEIFSLGLIPSTDGEHRMTPAVGESINQHLRQNRGLNFIKFSNYSGHGKRLKGKVNKRSFTSELPKMLSNLRTIALVIQFAVAIARDI